MSGIHSRCLLHGIHCVWVFFYCRDLKPENILLDDDGELIQLNLYSVCYCTALIPESDLYYLPNALAALDRL